MGIHDISIDGLLAGMPKAKRNKLRERILQMIYDSNLPTPSGGNVKSMKDAREKKKNGVVQLIR